jgi:hypothetical protein
VRRRDSNLELPRHAGSQLIVGQAFVQELNEIVCMLGIKDQGLRHGVDVRQDRRRRKGRANFRFDGATNGLADWTASMMRRFP